MNEIIINKVKKENNVNSSLLQHDGNRWNVRTDHCSNVHRHRDGEYDAKTLKDEFLRDKLENPEITLPENYFTNNDINLEPINRWRPYAFLLFSNFINEVYQDVPFEFCKQTIIK